MDSQQYSNTLLSDTTMLKTHVRALTQTEGYRNYQDTATLNQAATYIEKVFLQISSRVTFQKYRIEGREYKNIICSLGPSEGERIIVGAHYDVCDNQPGADDNASGVAGILELARLLKDQPLKYRIDIVAYTLEEPPFFKSTGMGSYVHAKYLHENDIPVKGMVCLEMIGYFSDKTQSQDYPIEIMRWFYGNKGDYILLVQKYGNGSFGRSFNREMRKEARLNTKFLRSPKLITGVDFSDHRNYWNFGYNAVMITNTAFYRNKNYHTTGDSIETLDFGRMARVVDGVLLTLTNINK
ncbi:MAG: M28 family peptidase [Bacteroidetes bacterium]|nr:M28 family peptidase [Bacteroidota bacterium]